MNSPWAGIRQTIGEALPHLKEEEEKMKGRVRAFVLVVGGTRFNGDAGWRVRAGRSRGSELRSGLGVAG